ncbi:MAG: ABC transporter ATP-binding protein [Clostridia bacterium]|nr:ABC transporter ATP-binding protein [Clostridia bacterium]
MKNINGVKEYIFNNKFFITIIIVSCIISTILTLIAPVLVGNVIENIVIWNIEKITWKILLIACIYMVVFILDYVSVINLSKLSSKIGSEIREKLFNKLHNVPISYIDKNSYGEIINKFSFDVENICIAIIQCGTKIVVGIVTIIGAIIIMIKLNYIMAIITFFSAPLMYFISRFIVNSSKERFKSRAEIISKLNGYTNDIISSSKTVKDYNYTKIAEDKFNKMNEKLFEDGKKAQFYSSLTNPCTRFVNNLTYIIIGIVGIILTKNGEANIGIITSFLLYVNIFARPFNEITGVMSELQTAISSSNKIKEFLESEEEVNSVKSDIKNVKGNIDFINVNFSYNKDIKFIENMNLSVKQGESIAIVGKTGAGKTSIVNLIMKFYNINKGKILIDGININDIPKDVLRRNIGIVLQDTKLFTGTIKENIAYGKKDATDEEIVNAAKLSGSDAFIRRLPNGYNTVITEKTFLSAGEIQLITIARMFLIKPPILILDEATSNVDIVTENKIQKSFLELMKGATTFIIAHHLSTIKSADRIIVVENGNIVEEGKHEELLRKKGKYYEIYEN